MIIPVIVKIFTKEHKITYTKDNYKIKETFYIDNKKHYYDINIKNKKIEITYTIQKNLHKQKKILSGIKLYKDGNVTCILPKYKTNLQKNIYCQMNNQQVSNYYLKNNKSYKNILNKLKKEHININIPIEKSNTESYKKIQKYKNNILNNYKYIVWDYKGIYTFDNRENNYIKILDYDIYDNFMKTVTSKYFVLFDNSSVLNIEKVYYYDLKKEKLKNFKLKEKLSKDTYINGVENDLIYLTDNKSKKEYTLNVSKQELKEIGNEEGGYIYYNKGKRKVLNKSDFFMNKQLFIERKELNNTEQIINKDYRYIKDNNEFYYKKNNYNKVLLFTLNNVSTWYIYENDIVLIKDDILYHYSENDGLKKILEYNELKYNYNNIIELWKY